MVSNNQIAQQLVQKEGTIEFKIDQSELFSESNSTPELINQQSADANSEVQLYREGDTLIYEHVHVEWGRRQCKVSLDGFKEFDRFRIFLTWSPEEANLYIGPHPPKDDVDLRSDTSQTR